jgi:hypothetical protein
MRRRFAHEGIHMALAAVSCSMKEGQMTLPLLPFPTAQRVLVGLLSLFGVAVLGADVSAAGALKLPDAVYKGFAPGMPGPDPIPNLSKPGTISGAHSVPGSSPPATEQWTVTLAGDPSPSALAGVDQSNDGAYAKGSVLYYMEISGGSGPTPVTVDLTASLFTSSYGDGGAVASLEIQGACSPTSCPFPSAEFDVCSVAEVGCSAGLPPTLNLVSPKVSLDSNTLYTVFIQATASAPVEGVSSLVNTGGARADVDPYFALDLSTPEGFSLAFSPGIGNSSTPTVPEPSSWILLCIGFAGAGFFRFSRKGLPQARA